MAEEPKPQEPAEPTTEQDDENALETPDSSSTDSSSGITDATNPNAAPDSKPAGPAPKKTLKQKLARFNLYLLLFIFILVLGIGIVVIAYFQSKKASNTSTLKTSTLTQQTLNQVAASDATVGNTQQVLNVQSSAVFAGKVLVREDLEVAGSLQIGGTVALSALTVSGTSQLGQVQINQNLSVNGDTGLQGSLTVAKSLQVNGTASFSGPITTPQITTSALNLNSDLRLTHHIIAGGATPGQTNGSALGGGGTASVSGSDTAGSVTINTGSSPAAGCFITVNFTSKYSSTPHVLITPVGSSAAGIQYYINRSTANFSICDASAPPAGSSFGFDYFVVD